MSSGNSQGISGIEHLLSLLNYGGFGLGSHSSWKACSDAYERLKELVLAHGPDIERREACVQFFSQRLEWEYGRLLDFRYGRNAWRPPDTECFIQILDAGPFFVPSSMDLREGLSRYVNTYGDPAAQIVDKILDLSILRARLTSEEEYEQVWRAMAFLLRGRIEMSLVLHGDSRLGGAAGAWAVLSDLGPEASGSVPELLEYYHPSHARAQLRVLFAIGETTAQYGPAFRLLKRAAHFGWPVHSPKSVIACYALLQCDAHTKAATSRLTWACHSIRKSIRPLAIAAVRRLKKEGILSPTAG